MDLPDDPERAADALRSTGLPAPRASAAMIEPRRASHGPEIQYHVGELSVCPRRSVVVRDVMPRRTTPSPTAAKVGARIRVLRLEKGLSLQHVAEVGQLSKGHLSSIEHGLAAITVETLERIARGLDVLSMDLCAFPEDDERARIADIVRKVPKKELPKLRRELAVRGASKS